MAGYAGEARQQVLRDRAEKLRAKRIRRTQRQDPAVVEPTGAIAAPISLTGGGLGSLSSSLKWGLGMALVAIIVLYWRTLFALQQVWEADPNYSHGYLVPLVSGFFAWRAYQRYGPPQTDGVRSFDYTLGMFEILAGIGLHAVAWFINAPLLDVVALVGILHGLLVVMAGIDMARKYSCPVLYLLFMAPIPIIFYQPVAIFMQQFVSVTSVALLQLCGVSAFREGYIVHVPGYQMEVGQACSGLRQLTAFLALSVAAAHLSDRGRWYKWSLVLLSVPTAVGANCIRVTGTGFIMMLFGEKWAKGVWHTLQGLAVFILGVGLFMIFSWVLMRVDDRLHGKTHDDEDDSSDSRSEEDDSVVTGDPGLVH